MSQHSSPQKLQITLDPFFVYAIRLISIFGFHLSHPLVQVSPILFVRHMQFYNVSFFAFVLSTLASVFNRIYTIHFAFEGARPLTFDKRKGSLSLNLKRHKRWIIEQFCRCFIGQLIFHISDLSLMVGVADDSPNLNSTQPILPLLQHSGLISPPAAM